MHSFGAETLRYEGIFCSTIVTHVGSTGRCLSSVLGREKKRIEILVFYVIIKILQQRL